MISRYPGLADITDPATKRALKQIFDMVGGLQQQATAIGSVSQPLTTPLNAGSQRLMALADPTAPQDAVTKRYLEHYVESRVQTLVASSIATVPGAPGGPPAPSTPAPPVTPPSGNPTTGALTHGFDLAPVTIYNSPPDIASWPVTGTITKVSIIPGPGVYITCNKVSPPNASPPPAPGEWPQDPSIYPDAIGLQYTLWVALKVSGVWAASGFIQMWLGRPGTAALPIGNDFATNWAYDGRWGTLNGQTPTPGTQMGFLVSAGNARGFTGVSTVRERSEVVLLNLPDANGGTFT